MTTYGDGRKKNHLNLRIIRNSPNPIINDPKRACRGKPNNRLEQGVLKNKKKEWGDVATRYKEMCEKWDTGGI